MVLRFQQGIPVTGTVVDENGKPARVSVWATMGRRRLGNTITDEAGRFTLYAPRKLRGTVMIGARIKRDGVVYTASAEYVPGAAVRLQLKTR